MDSYFALVNSQVHEKDAKKVLASSLRKFFDNDGTLLVTAELEERLLQVVSEILRLNNVELDILDIDVFRNFRRGSRMSIKSFFETSIFNISNRITEDIEYEKISEILFKIYLYATTLNTFEDYVKFNKEINVDNIEDIRKLSDFISENVDPFLNEFNTTSFKLLILGHLCKGNVLDIENVLFERIEYSFARTALELTKGDRSDVISVFLDMYETFYAPSTTMFYNSLHQNNLLSSCFLIGSEKGHSSIGSLLEKISVIQSFSAGIGVNMTNISSEKSTTKLVEILAKIGDFSYDNKRQRSSNMNLTFSIDSDNILEVIDLKAANERKEDSKFNNIFISVSIPDEFMIRLIKRQDWFVMSSDIKYDGKYLSEIYGDEYSKQYNKMINDPSVKKTKMSAVEIVSKIINVMLQSGSPFLFFKDTVNNLSNQKNLGIIPTSNLCTEILEVSNEVDTPCCNLTSFNLKKFVKNHEFDWKTFGEKIERVVKLQNNVIEHGLYLHETCKHVNLRTRPMGLGIQGLANAINKLGMVYIKSHEFYKQISEVMYYHSLKASMELVRDGLLPCYEGFVNSPLSEGLFSFDLFKKYQNKKIGTLEKMSNYIYTGCDPSFYSMDLWNQLRADIQKYGVANSLFLAFMPTSLSSGIYNNVESFEPYTYNIQKRSFSMYDIIVYNEYLVDFCLTNKYYTKKNIIPSLIEAHGCFDKLERIPMEIREKYRPLFETVYDFKHGEYSRFVSSNNHIVDQGKSTNLYVKENSNIQILKTIIDIWLYGSKTTYYFRPETKVDPLTLSDFKNTCTACSS